jgi:RNA polymerase sigma-70 factor (ECF subfamily)
MDAPGDDELVDLAVGGDAEAFGRLLERHYMTIYRVAYKMCRVQADAEEIAQSVCEKLGRSIHGYGRQAAFSSWLYSVTVNAARDFLRAQARRERKHQPLDPDDETAVATPASQDHGVLRQEIWDKVATLPERQRLAVILVYGEGLGHAQAAEVLGCAVGTVGWHIHQAIANLRALVRERCHG